MSSVVSQSLIVVSMLSGLVFSLPCLAQVTIDDFKRLPADEVSGSGHSVRSECGAGVDGFDAARADLLMVQSGATSRVRVKVRKARPNTLVRN